VTPAQKNGDRVSGHSKVNTGPGSGRRPGRRRRVAARPVVVGVLLVAVAAVLTQTGVHLEFGGDSASAAIPSQFTVVHGAIRKATGVPVPPSGTQASLWANSSVATTTIEGSGRVVFGAVGDNCYGWPVVQVTADGKVVGSTTIGDAHQYGMYPVGEALGAGKHTVTFRLSNDRYSPPTCDRNVHIGYAEMEFDATGDPPPPISTLAPTTAAPIPTLKPVPPPATPTATATATTTPPAPPAPAPPAGGKPGAGNTGVPVGTKLTAHQGDLTVSTPGTVIDAMDIHGFLKIRADNVTVKRTLIRGGTVAASGFSQLVSAFPNEQRGLVIEDSTLLADHPADRMDGLKGAYFTARRLNISNVVDTALVYGNDVTIQDSWLHGNTHFEPFPAAPDNKTHDDSLQIQGGSNIVVSNNVLEGAYNTAIMVTQDVSRTAKVQVTGNWLSGGGCTVNLSEKGKGPIEDFRLSHNRFGGQRLTGCAVIAPPTSDVTLDGDVWDATGQRVVIKVGT
jgi:hypothetical protein